MSRIKAFQRFQLFQLFQSIGETIRKFAFWNHWNYWNFWNGAERLSVPRIEAILQRITNQVESDYGDHDR
jgi:hypothetical protein